MEIPEIETLINLLLKQIKSLEVKEQCLIVLGKKAWNARRHKLARAHWTQAQKCAEEIQQLRLQVADCSNRIEKIYKALYLE